MKRIIIILLLALVLAAPALADWRSNGTSTNPLIQAYYTTLYSGTMLPLVSGTGTIGASGSAFDIIYADSATIPIISAATKITTSTLNTSEIANSYNGKSRIHTGYTNAWWSISGGNGNTYVWLADTTANDTTRGWFVGKYAIRGKATGSTASADTIKFSTNYKKVFGNSAANIRDTILCAGVKTDSTICSPAYIYDSGASTWNALTYYVRPDTVFTIRQAATDPDSFSISIVKKK